MTGRTEPTPAGRPIIDGLPAGQCAELVVLDWDRTLCDTSAVLRHFNHVAANHFDIEPETIQRAQRAVEADGGSFSPLDLLERFFSQDESFPQVEAKRLGAAAQRYMEEFRDIFVESAPDALLYADARRLLQRLGAAGIAPIVMTYGVDPRWQQWKLNAGHYQGLSTIMTTNEKGPQLAAWWSEKAGRFQYITDDGGAMTAPQACLVDDKASSFADLPEHTAGVWLCRDKGNELPSQAGAIDPAKVTEIRSLDEITITAGRIAVI